MLSNRIYIKDNIKYPLLNKDVQVNDKGDNIFTIQRIGILGTESFFDFLLKISRVRNKL